MVAADRRRVGALEDRGGSWTFFDDLFQTKVKNFPSLYKGTIMSIVVHVVSVPNPPILQACSIQWTP